MKILGCTQLFTSIILLDFVGSQESTVIEWRDGIQYGLKYEGTVYPAGTFNVLPGQLRPRWAHDSIEPHRDDRLSRKGDKIARPSGTRWFAMNAAGGFAMKGTRTVEIKPENGDKLERGGFYIAVYEGCAFRLYKEDFRFKALS